MRVLSWSKNGNESVMSKPFISVINENGERVAVENPNYNPLDANPGMYDSLLALSKIPSDYYDIDFEDYIGTGSLDAVKKVIKYSDNFFNPAWNGKGLYLFGPNRTQKTALASCVGKEVLRKGKRVLYLQGGKFQKVLQNSENFEPDKQTQDHLTQIEHGFYDLLIIDDVLDDMKQVIHRSNPGYIISPWNAFFNVTLKNKQKMILTSNVSLNKVGETFSGDIQELLMDYLYPLEFLDTSKEVKRSKLKELFEED